MHPRDLLSAIQINRAAVHIFAGSPKLQDKLSLRSAKDGFIASPFYIGSEDEDEAESGFTTFEVTYETISPREYPRYDAEGHRKHDHRVGIDASFLQFDPLPQIGSRTRRMLICQPLVKVMQIVPSCCYKKPHTGEWVDIARRWAVHRQKPDCGTPYGEEDETLYVTDESVEKNDVVQDLEIQVKTGVTVGDVLDATRKIREAHALCPHADFDCHDTDGKVCPEVRFSTDITLKNDDPYVVSEARAEAERALVKIEEEAAKGALEVYIRAKRTGQEFHNGKTIIDYD